MYCNWPEDSGNTTVDNSGHGNYGINNDSTTFNPHSVTGFNRPGGIALSWDDTGHIVTCYQYLSIFQKYNATCTMNVNKLSNSKIPQETLLYELNALHEAGWEIAAHGYNHTNSVTFLSNHTPTEWLDQEIFPNIVEITRYGYPVSTLAYPYSDRRPTTDAIVAPYFRTLRTGVPDVINDNVNQTPLAYYDWDDAQLLYGVEIDEHTDTSLQSILYGIDRAIEDGTVLVLYGHTITENVAGRYQTSTARLDAILNYTSNNGGVFYRMGELGNTSWEPLPRFSNVTANFTASTNILFAGRSVTFTDYSINQTTELLDFGDGSPASNTANIVHTYTTPGTYTVNLTVTNDVFSDSMLQTIKVVEPATPVANFTSNCTTGNQPLSVAFTDTSTGVRTSWEWDFGDGNTSTGQNPVHEYSSVGNYSVRLTVTNDEGSNSTQKVNYITVLPQPPSANFYSNVTSGNVPLTVQFCDSSTGTPASWNWDFGDGYTSTEQNPVHTYCTAGTFNICLAVSNTGGASSKTASISVLEESSSEGSNSGGSSHSSSGKSSGGGGGSPELAKNVEVKELSQVFITNDNPAKFNFQKNATVIVYLSFDSKKTVGKTTTIVEMLKNKSTLTPEAPEGEVYSYLNIWVGNSGYATEKNIENAVVCFRVEKAWIQDKGIEQASIFLNRYSEKKWNELPCTLLREDDEYLYFTAETPEFSPFAITGKLTVQENVIEILPEPDQVPEQNESMESEIEEKPEKTMPGFEIIYCIIGIFGIFLWRRG
ncbi:PGF-pre-PGF domain-containing protein [Methanosarcina siciliae]|nr:PGF-pre-PGF domain-containing protein [Methanosarcina siciliae]